MCFLAKRTADRLKPGAPATPDPSATQPAGLSLDSPGAAAACRAVPLSFS
jgi:hypothetical protein